jgi:hypothetical protein
MINKSDSEYKLPLFDINLVSKTKTTTLENGKIFILEKIKILYSNGSVQIKTKKYIDNTSSSKNNNYL